MEYFEQNVRKRNRIAGTVNYRMESGTLTERVSLQGGARAGAGRPKSKSIHVEPNTYLMFKKHKSVLGFKNDNLFIQYLLGVSGLGDSHAYTPRFTNGSDEQAVDNQDELTTSTSQDFHGDVKKEPSSDSEERYINHCEVSQLPTGAVKPLSSPEDNSLEEDINMEDIPNISQVKYLDPKWKYKKQKKMLKFGSKVLVTTPDTSLPEKTSEPDLLTVKQEPRSPIPDSNDTSPTTTDYKRADDAPIDYSKTTSPVCLQKVHTELFNFVQADEEEREPGEITPSMRGRNYGANSDRETLRELLLSKEKLSSNDPSSTGDTETTRGFVSTRSSSQNIYAKLPLLLPKPLLLHKTSADGAMVHQASPPVTDCPTLKSREVMWIATPALQAQATKSTSRRKPKETKFIEYQPGHKRKRVLGGFVLGQSSQASKTPGAISDGFESGVLNEKMGSKMFRFKINKPNEPGRMKQGASVKTVSLLSSALKCYKGSAALEPQHTSDPAEHYSSSSPSAYHDRDQQTVNSSLFTHASPLMSPHSDMFVSKEQKTNMAYTSDSDNVSDSSPGKVSNWTVRKQLVGDGTTMKYFEMAHTCVLCGKTFMRLLTLQNHMKLHESGIFFCRKCSFVSDREEDLKNHLNSKHPRELVNVCNNCGKKYSDGEIHLCNKTYINQNDSRRRVLCPEPNCEQCFTSHTIMKLHFKRAHLAHLNAHPHRCDYPSCIKSFATISQLRRHFLTHYTEKNHQCSYCKVYFRTSWQLKIHVRRHTGEKPLVCQYCGFSCRQKNSLDWHMLRKHP